MRAHICRNKVRWKYLLAAVLVGGAVSARPAGALAGEKDKPYLGLSAVEALQRLDQAGVSREWGFRPSDVEIDLLESAATGRPFDDDALADACLVACGVTDANQRQAYARRLDEFFKRAHAATADAPSPGARAQRLLQALHAGPMSKGYVSQQCLLSALLDSGQYNCVSSSVIFYLFGRRLGLEQRAVVIPGGYLTGHMFVEINHDDRWVDVETTNPDGYDASTKLKQPGVISLSFTGNRDGGREISGLAVAAVIYYNRGVEMLEKKEFAGAARVCLCALGLDPIDESSANNLLAAFLRWTDRLAAEQKFEDALRLMDSAVAIMPEEWKLQKRQSSVWRQFAESYWVAGDDLQAIEVLRKAAQALPKGDFENEQALLFIRPAENLFDQQQWPAAIALADRGLKVVDARPAKRLREFRSNTYRLWSQQHLKEKEYSQASAILVQGLTEMPGDDNLLAGVRYLAQEMTNQLAASQGPAAAAAALTRLREQFPQVKEIAEIGAGHAWRAVRRLASEGKYTDARAMVEHYAPLLNHSDRQDAACYVYNAQGRDLGRQGKWPEAIGVYLEGLKAWPGNSLLCENVIVAYDRWARTAMDKQDWSRAAEICRQGLQAFPDSSHLEGLLEYCQKRQK